MRGLAGKSFIITGGARGIGRSICLRLGEEGARVVVADRNAEGASTVAAELAAAGSKAVAVTIEVTSRDSWRAAFELAAGTFGPIDGLVNNAGLTRDKSLLKMSDAEWDEVIDVNLKGAWIGSQLAVAAMVGRGGAIVNLSSESRWGAFGQVNYASAKAGLVGLTRTTAIEAARHGIRANAIAPGTTRTPMVEAVPAEVRASWLPTIPLRREAEPSEIAAAVVFLLSDDASYITGQILGVNGGSAL